MFYSLMDSMSLTLIPAFVQFSAEEMKYQKQLMHEPVQVEMDGWMLEKLQPENELRFQMG